VNPPAVIGLLVRGLPWALIRVAGAVVGAAPVRGARTPVAPPAIAGSPAEDEAEGACSPGISIAVAPTDVAAGALAGRLLALVLEPRPLGAFLGGLAAGALAAALVPAHDLFPAPPEGQP